MNINILRNYVSNCQLDAKVKSMKESILFIDIAGFKPLPDLRFLELCSSGLTTFYTSEPAKALDLIHTTENAKVLIINAPKPELFFEFLQKNPNSHTILITDLPLAVYSPELGCCEERLIKHIIANRFPSAWSENELRVSLRKLLKQDFFGIDKYLESSARTVSLKITGSAVKEAYCQELANYARSLRLGTHFAKQVSGITEELLTNAIFDAPLKVQNGRYVNSIKKRKIVFDEADQGELCFGSNGSVFAIGVRDLFGTLPKEHFFDYLRKVMRRNEDFEKLIDTKEIGAGLGLYKIFYHSHALICNSIKGQITEVISLIDLNFKVKDFGKIAKSVHFFSEEKPVS